MDRRRVPARPGRAGPRRGCTDPRMPRVASRRHRRLFSPACRERFRLGEHRVCTDRGHTKRHKIPSNPNTRITPPIVPATIATFFCSKSSAMTTAFHACSIRYHKRNHCPAKEKPRPLGYLNPTIEDAGGEVGVQVGGHSVSSGSGSKAGTPNTRRPVFPAPLPEYMGCRAGTRTPGPSGESKKAGL